MCGAATVAILGAGIGALPMPAQAQTAQAARDIDIPAGSLGNAIAQLGRKTGVMIVFDPALVRGKRTLGLRGPYTPAQALDRLLAGTGIEARPDGRGGFTIQRTRVVQSTPAARQGPRAITHEPEPSTLDAANTPAQDIVVTAQRTRAGIVAPGHQVTIIDRQSVESGRAASDTLATLLAKAVPGLADSSRVMSDFGQTLRGRLALVLVDGVPYNNNRNASRDLISLDPGNIDRIEVLRGSSAIYGGGASGGIISITTRPAGGPLRLETTLSGTASLSRITDEGLSGRLTQFVSGSAGGLDFALNGTLQHVGGSYDARGDRRAPEPSQGDQFDSNIVSIGGKIGMRIDDMRYFQVSGGFYRLDQDSDYASDPAPARLSPGTALAGALKGLELAEQNQVRNTILTVNYADRDLFGSRLDLLGYYRDTFLRFTPNDLRSSPNRGNNVDQVMQNSTVLGGRLTIETPLAARTSLTWGGDFNQEKTDMPLDVFDPAAYDASGGLVFDRTGTLIYMPKVTTRTFGGLAQLQHRFADWLGIEGGARYDRVRASFEDFTPLNQYRVAVPGTVTGGSVTYDAWTFNGSVTVTPVADHDVYASFSQGFQLPDVGLQVRNARPGFNIRGSELSPVKIDSYEIGWRGRFDRARATLALFQTNSKLGDIQSLNNALFLLRTAEKIRGVEAAIDVGESSDPVSAGASVTYIEGRERPANASASRIMTGYRIPPLKVTAYVGITPLEGLNIRLQGLLSGDRDYRLNDATSFGRRKVEQYVTFDLLGSYRLNERGLVTAGIENIFNEQYLPVYSQLLRNDLNSTRIPANGATLTVAYRHSW
nr:TonB-dependent receptor [Sphingobium sp. BHU LFT2]